LVVRAGGGGQESIHCVEGNSPLFGVGHQFSPQIGDRDRNIDDSAGKSFEEIDAKPSVERRFDSAPGL
jgi:hypothetical protein